MKLSANECENGIASANRTGDRGHPWSTPDLTSNDWHCKCMPRVGVSCEAPGVSLFGLAQDYMDENIMQQIPSFEPEIGCPAEQDLFRSRSLGPRMGSQVLRAGGDHAASEFGLLESDSIANGVVTAQPTRRYSNDSVVSVLSEVPTIEVLLRTCLDRDKDEPEKAPAPDGKDESSKTRKFPDDEDESAKARSQNPVTPPIGVPGARPRRRVQDVVLPGQEEAVEDCIIPQVPVITQAPERQEPEVTEGAPATSPDKQVAQGADCKDSNYQSSNHAQLYLEGPEQSLPSLVGQHAADVVESPRPKTKVQKKVFPVASAVNSTSTVNADQPAPGSNLFGIATNAITGITDSAKGITNHVITDITDNVKVCAEAAQHSAQEFTGNAKVCAEEVKHKAEEFLDAITHVDNGVLEQEPPVAQEPLPPEEHLGSAVTFEKVDSFLTAEQDNIFGFSRSISGFTRENSHRVDICPENGVLTMRKPPTDPLCHDPSVCDGRTHTILSPDESIVNLRNIRCRQQQETGDITVDRIHRKYADDLKSMPYKTYRDYDKLFGLPPDSR